MKDIFVYGTLMNEEVFSHFANGKFEKYEATLSDYKRVKVIGKSYPAIRPNSSCCVEGLLITGLSSRNLEILDEFEGEFYDRVPVVVDISQDEQHSCEAYVFKEEYEYMLSNESWCNNTFREKYLKDYLRGHVV